MKQPENTRVAAARIIGRWLATGDFLDRQLEAADPQNRGLIMELVYGAGRWKRLLEWAIGRCSRKLPRRGLRSFLLVGAYEVLLMGETDDYATVNEIVEAVKEEYSGSEAGFVNAVMRKLAAEKHEIMRALQDQPPGIRMSHPDVLIDRWKNRFGNEDSRSLFEWNNGRANIAVRVNFLKTGAPEFRALLDRTGVEITDDSRADKGWFVLGHGTRVSELPGYDNGLFAVLDPAAGAAVDLLDPRPGEDVLDACAAPGGKTFLIAERMRKRGRLDAADLRSDRLSRLRKNMARLECDDFVNCVRADAAGLAPAGARGFDRILLDVPCSNTGVIRRRPDARWIFSESRLAGLVSVQGRILNSGLSALRPGGSLVYSTCSLEREENRGLVQSCLNNRPGFDLVEEREIFPPRERADGAYAALIRRGSRSVAGCA